MASNSPSANPDDRLHHQIFSILESNLLFGPKKPRGRVRILSLDAGAATDGLLAATSLSHLESFLVRLSGDPSARIADFFDVAAGSGAGSVLVSLLFSRGPDSRPLLSAAEALRFLAANRRLRRRGLLRKRASALDDLLKNLTLRDTLRPVLIPCHDMATGAPFVFSRADAVETDGYDFRMREVCSAAMGAGERVVSIDGRTGIVAAAADGGAVTGNPAAVAVTHVLNNRVEFPAAEGVDDLFLVSIGNGEGGGAKSRKKTDGVVRIAGDGVSDMVDQAIAMAFGSSRAANYVRLQGRELVPQKMHDNHDSAGLLNLAEEMLQQRSVESVLFHGKKLAERTNMEKLEWVAEELVKEQERRKTCPVPIVSFKQSHNSSSTSSVSSPVSSP